MIFQRNILFSILISIPNMYEQENLSHYEWMQVFEKLKNDSTYKFLYTDVDAYEKKLNKMLTQDYRYHKNLMKKSQHNLLLENLKVNFLKISGDLHLLDLSPLALCIDNIFDSLLNCLRSAFLGFTNCISLMREEQSTNQSKFFSLERCQQCQSNIQKIKIQSLKTSVTLCEGKPSQNQINRLNSQLDGLGLSFEDVQLSLMIDEVLQGKDNVLNAKNNQITAIYEEIAQYLQNIPKQTLTMGREDQSSSEKNKFLGVANISKQIQNGLSDMLKDPVRKLVTRVFYYFKNKNKQKKFNTIDTQTNLITDEETIKTLTKSNEKLRKEFQHLKQAKRQSERQYIKMFDEKQINEIKIKQMENVKEFLEEKCHKLQNDIKKVRKSLTECENSKKVLGDNLIKEYTAEKSSFLRTIHQLQITLESNNKEIKRLRKMTQGSMISHQTQTCCPKNTVQTQTNGAYQTSNYDEMNLLFPSSNMEFSLLKNSSFMSKKSIKKKKSNINNQEPSQKSLSSETKQKLPEQSKESLSASIDFQSQPHSPMISIHQQVGRKSIIQKVEVIEDERISEEIVVTLNKKQLQKQSSKGKQSVLSFGQNDQDAVDESQKAGSNRMMRKQSSGHLRLHSNIKRRETANSGDIRALNLLVEGKKRVSKARSSRMFIPVQHCSPYIGPKFQGQMNWLDIIEQKKVKKDRDDLQKEIANEEDIEKIQFVSKLYFSYQELKQKGVLDQIQTLYRKYPEVLTTKPFKKKQKKVSCLKIQIPNLQKASNRQQKNDHIIKMQPSCSKIPLTPTKVTRQSLNPPNISKENPKKGPQILQVKNMSISNNINHQKNLFSDSPIFMKKHILLLFQSEHFMKKYEKCEQIWSLLESSIMVDSSFGSLCDSASNFISKLQKNNLMLYQECINLLRFPLKYLKKLQKNEFNANKTDSFKRKVQKNLQHRKFSGLGNEQNEGQEFVNISPSQLRHTLIKLLRFHKVIHRKCSHVQEFLAIIGFKPSSI